jgi:hypothetical protein
MRYPLISNYHFHPTFLFLTGTKPAFYHIPVKTYEVLIENPEDRKFNAMDSVIG